MGADDPNRARHGMAIGRVNGMIGHLRRAAFRCDGAGLSDGQLLECYLAGRDEAALEALIRRHGPMVLGVCRRVIGHHHDAEDAFQATFLVLVRKAASVRPRDQVANWLYGVAYQTARKARAVAARRRARERQVTDMPERAAPPHDGDSDLPAVLDQELSGLPDRYRVPIVLCDLEGKTRKEAARQLGWPEGTVSGRLSRGRVLLARRLAARGVVVAGAALAAGAASAAVPATLVTSTVQTAALFAAGKAAAASAKAACLAEGVLKAMLVTKLKVATVVVLALGVVGLGAGFGPYGTLTAADNGGQPAQAQGGGPGQQEKLLREKVTRLEKELQQERAEKEKALLEKERLEKIERLEIEVRQLRKDKERLLYVQQVGLAQREMTALEAEKRVQDLERRLREEQAKRRDLEERLRRLEKKPEVKREQDEPYDLLEEARRRALVEQQQQEQKDAEFVRRLYLDLWGQPPSAQEVREFIAAKDAKKLEKLIDKLLDDPEMAKAVRQNLRKWLHDYYEHQMERKAGEESAPSKRKP
jgi:RNA polymerase sigma factor (sigma-70 family)